MTDEEYMLLSIDRLLQLLAEGKSVQQIAELADVEAQDVCNVIDDARKLLMSCDKSKTKKKIIIKKRSIASDNSSTEDDIDTGKDEKKDEIFNGAELSAIPLGSSLMMYTDGASAGNPGPAGIGIVINDKEDRVVGRVSSYIGDGTNNFAEYSALIRALKIAIYFKTKDLKIRTDSELIVKQIKGEYKVNSDKIKPLYEEAIKLKKVINSCRIEHVPRTFNDKADYLAKKAITTFKDSKKKNYRLT